MPGIAPGTFEQATSDSVKSKQAERDASPSHDCFLTGSEASHGSAAVTTKDYGNVAFSGNVLSVTFTVPYTLRYRKGEPWEPKFHHYRSANMDSLTYLSSRQSRWNHTLVAWIGEISHASDNTVSSETPFTAPFSSSIAYNEAIHNKTTSPGDIFITNEDKKRLEQQLYSDNIRTVPVWLADNGDVTSEGIKLTRQSRWRRYAERDLCALFHYKQHPPTSEYKEVRWNDYYSMNKAFADNICDIYQPGDIIVVHDYYLALLPRMLRERYPHIYVAFFLASPFPTSELMRCLSRRKEILEGMLGSSLIGFAAKHYLHHFTNSCTRILSYHTSTNMIESSAGKVHLDVFLVGIDVPKVKLLAYADSVDEKYAELKKLYAGKKIIIGYDLLDRLGGVDKKLQAFRRFLEYYPSWQGKVVLIQTTAAKTVEDDDGDESKYATKVNDLAISINSMYGSLDYIPVQISARQLSRDEYFALLRIGHVALNTCVREGISITSLEYIACQHEEAWGVPIISEFSGMASNMEEAIRINPWDFNRVADQINTALTLSEAKKREQHDALFARVTESDAETWADTLLRRLGEVLEVRN